MATPWSRLQTLSCAHAMELWRNGIATDWSRVTRRVSVPEVIRENVEILGRGDDEEIKARVLWYITFHPGIFDQCSKSGWEVL